MITTHLDVTLYNGMMDLYCSERMLTTCLAGLPMTVTEKNLAKKLHLEFFAAIERTEELEAWLELRFHAQSVQSCQTRIQDKMWHLTQLLYVAKLTPHYIIQTLNIIQHYRLSQYKMLQDLAITQGVTDAQQLMSGFMNSEKMALAD